MEKIAEIHQLIDHLFRHESGKLVSVLTRLFGSENIDLAEDVVQDSLMEAIKAWTYNGIPDNPSGWLFRVAKNKALNIVTQDKNKVPFSPAIVRLLSSYSEDAPPEEEISDDQLRMMFTCCHPSISPDSQIALMLRTLCGFGIPEIAKAFLTTDENVNKRLVRARQKIRESKIRFEVPAGAELERGLQTVLAAIYLLFNEGYSASSGADLIRFEVCEEAIRLTEIIINDGAITDKSDTYALLALMQLNTSRFQARQDQHGNILTLEQQDRSLWNATIARKGFINLNKALTNGAISTYHILASISSYHCAANDYASTDWASILDLYDRLIQIDSSPLVLLNRTVALSKVRGAEQALVESERLKDTPSLRSYHLFYSVLAEFYWDLGRYPEAAVMLQTAIDLAPLESEKLFLQKKLALCKK